MALQQKGQFNTRVNSELADNTSGLITPKILRDMVTDMGDSFVWEGVSYRTAESFGCVSVGFDSNQEPATTPVNNLAAMELAREWSIATGGVVLFGSGIYGFDGTFRLKPHLNMRGAGRNDTHFWTLHTDMSDGFSSLLSGDDPTTTGASWMTLRDFTINCHWNKMGSGGSWNYPATEMTQRGMYLYAPTNSAQLKAIHRGTANDNYSVIDNIAVKGAKGTGLVIEGRGEMMLSRLALSGHALGGLDCKSPDNWMRDFTISSCGQFGAKIGAGNQRMADFKAWFIGLMKGEAPLQGLIFDGAGNKNIIAQNMSTQDTWGAGVLVNGQGITVNGNIDEACGGRIVEQGFGYTGSRTSTDNAYVVIAGATGCELDFSMTGSINNSITRRVARLHSSGHQKTKLKYTLDMTNNNPATGGITEAVTAAGGSTNNKRHVTVVRQDGAVIYGAWDLATYGDSTHGVNLHKKTGTKETLNTGIPIYSAGDLPTSAWLYADGTVAVTPT